MASLTPVHFADGFDGPDTVAFGLEAPELSVVVAGGLLASAIAHSAAPPGLRMACAALVALTAAALGWGRPHGRSLLRWSGLALRFAAAPRRGGGWVAAVEGGDGEAEGHEETEPAWARWLREAAPGRRREEPAGPAAGQDARRDAAAPARAQPSAATVAGGGAGAVAAEAEGGGETGAETASAAPGPVEPPAPRGRRRAAAAAPRARRRPSSPAVAGVDDDGSTVEVRRPPIVLLPRPAHRREAEPEAPRAPAGSPAAPAPTPGIVPLLRRTGGVEVEVAETAGPAAPAGGCTAPVFVGATRRITFFSLNGGAGRTTLATELACLLAARGRHRPTPDAPARPLRVALLDLDLRSATVAVRLGIPQPTLWDYLLAGDQGAGALDRYMVTHPSGLRALLGPPKPLAQAATVEPARVAEIVHRLECDGTHFLVVDVGADLGAVTTWVLSAVHDIYVVLTPTASGVQDAYRSTEALRRLGLGSKLRYVVNRARPGMDLGEVMGDLGGRIAASVPFDPRIEEAENAHRIAALDGGGPAAGALARLAADVYPGLGEPPSRRRLALFGRRRLG
jgi:MinD-like ATPase involved in chromosome partitioning or flagellar assembly